ncbi:MAG: mismatch-specific DNA-glycosylase [Armatimonadota bacterium]
MEELSPLEPLIAEDLDLLFVGINPSLKSARVGHYYAGPGNLFWRCLHESGLTPYRLQPTEDRKLLQWGMGITDCVPRPSRNAAEVKRHEFREAAPLLLARIESLRPKIICFNGLTGYRGAIDPEGRLGLQERRLGGALVFVVPSTSAANAGFSREERVEWFRRLKELVDRVRAGESSRPAGDILT